MLLITLLRQLHLRGCIAFAALGILFGVMVGLVRYAERPLVQPMEDEYAAPVTSKPRQHFLPQFMYAGDNDPIGAASEIRRLAEVAAFTCKNTGRGCPK